MNAYSIALFLHIVGAVGIFVALGLEWTGLRQIRSATSPEPVRGWMRILGSQRGFGFVSMFMTVITGIYMMLRVWGSAAWVIVTLGSLVLVMALAMVLSAPRMAAIGRALAMEKAPLSMTFRSLANQPALWISIQTRVGIALGIVFLKIFKPNLAGSLLVIGIAILLGLVAALSMRPHREHAQEAPADRPAS